jgi:hypothetical protein
VASIYPAFITFVHHKHLLNKDIDLSAKFEKYPRLIGKTLRRLTATIRDKTQLQMARRLDIHNRKQTSNRVGQLYKSQPVRIVLPQRLRPKAYKTQQWQAKTLAPSRGLKAIYTCHVERNTRILKLEKVMLAFYVAVELDT